MYFYFLSNILSRQSNQKHFKNIKQFKVVPSRLNIFPFQAHLRPLSNKVYYRILNITQLTLSCTAFILPPLQHTEQCVIEHTHSIDADNLHPNITPEQCSALGKLGGYYPGADRREREQEQMYFLGSLQWQCSSNSYHVRLEECVEHVHNARDVVQHCAVQVSMSKREGLLMAAPGSAWTCSTAATSSPCMACLGLCLLQPMQWTERVANGYMDPKLKLWCGCGGSVLKRDENVMLRGHDHDLLEAVFSKCV